MGNLPSRFVGNSSPYLLDSQTRRKHFFILPVNRYICIGTYWYIEDDTARIILLKSSSIHWQDENIFLLPGNVFFLLINLEPVAAQSHFSPHLKDPKARDSSSKSRQENGRNKQRKKESDRSIGTGAQRHRKKRDSTRGTTIETNKRGQNRPRYAYGGRNKDFQRSCYRKLEASKEKDGNGDKECWHLTRTY